MKKSLIYSLLFGIFLYFGVGELAAQDYKLDRSVLGSGGMIEAKNSLNQSMSGIVGQLAIENIAGTYNGRALDVWQGFWVPSGTATDVQPVAPVSANGLRNFPNPVSIYTTIQYNLPGTARVSLKIFDVQGRLMKVLFDGIQDAGNQEAQWNVTDQNGLDVTSGSYLYELNVNPAQNAGSDGFQPFTLRNVMVVVR